MFNLGSSISCDVGICVINIQIEFHTNQLLLESFMGNRKSTSV